MTGLLVQIRGASGSGKSTLVRRWVEDHGPPLKYMVKNAAAFGLGQLTESVGAARPFALACPVPDRPRVIVPGHYEAAGGGADMIKSKSHICDVIDRALALDHNVLVESLFLSKDVNMMWSRYGGYGGMWRILWLDVPEEECLESVHARRTALGREYRPMRAHARDFADVRKAVSQLTAKGACVERHDRDSCAARVRELLG